MATAFSLDRYRKSGLLDRIRAVREGLPARALKEVLADPAVTLVDISRVVGTRRTLDRRLKDNSALSPEEGDKLMMFVRVLDLSTHILGSREKAMRWLREPKHALEEQAPLDLMRTSVGAGLVEDMLVASQHGMMA